MPVQQLPESKCKADTGGDSDARLCKIKEHLGGAWELDSEDEEEEKCLTSRA